MTSGIGDLADALAAGLEDPGEVPTYGPEIVKYAGGRDELVRALSGFDRSPKKGDYPGDAEAYKAAHTRWRTAQRRAQRWDDEGKAGKQARGRGGRVKLAEDQQERLREEAQDRRLLGLWKHGARVRLTLLMKVPSPGPGKKQEPARERTLPAGPGELIKAGALEPILEKAAQGDDTAAGMMLLEAFGDAYGFDLLDAAEIVEVVRVKIWPEGTREPA